MNIMRLIISILFLVFIHFNSYGQFFAENLNGYHLDLFGKCHTPKEKTVQDIKQRPAVFVLYEFDESKIRKKYKNEADSILEIEREFQATYNSYLDKFMDLYPYGVKKIKMTLNNFNKLKSHEKYTYISIIENDNLSCGLTTNRKFSTRNNFAYYSLPIDKYRIIKEGASIEAELTFFIQRMVHYFDRMALGSKKDVMLKMKLRTELNKKLTDERNEVTLLYDGSYFNSEITEDQFSKAIGIPCKLVSTKEIENLILNPVKGYWYLKIFEIVGWSTNYNTNYGATDPIRTYKTGYKATAHYIIDPIGGIGLLLNFMGGEEVDKTTLVMYNHRLNFATLSLNWDKLK